MITVIEVFAAPENRAPSVQSHLIGAARPRTLGIHQNIHHWFKLGSNWVKNICKSQSKPRIKTLTSASYVKQPSGVKYSRKSEKDTTPLRPPAWT